MTALAEVRVTIFWERPAKAREVTDAVIQAAPVSCKYWLHVYQPTCYRRLQFGERERMGRD